jgi:hypothetical protein
MHKSKKGAWGANFLRGEKISPLEWGGGGGGILFSDRYRKHWFDKIYSKCINVKNH